MLYQPEILKDQQKVLLIHQRKEVIPMNEAMIQTLITAIITLVGTFGGILTAQKLSNYRIEQLEKKVEKHNNVLEKTYGLQKDVEEIRKDIDRIDKDQESLSEKVNNINTRVTLLEKKGG